MKKQNRIATLMLIAIMLTMSFGTSFGEELLIMPINAPVELPQNEYVRTDATLEEVIELDNYVRILVKNDKEEGLDRFFANIGENTLLLSQTTMDKAEAKLLSDGTKVAVFYRTNTPMALSEPPQLTPQVVVIMDGDENTNTVMVEKFDENLLSADGSLVIRVGDDTVVVDKEGSEVEKDLVAGNELAIFYKFVLESYPGQTTPEKIIVLPGVEVLEEDALILTQEMLKSEGDVIMIPLRAVAEFLGYEIKWDGTNKTVEMTRGPQWTLVTIGRNTYNFAKMMIRLETAPVIHEGRTYVPLSFIEQVFKANTELLPDGEIKVTL
ncbi:MAG: copper amine oxidase N-terminal domain-containing protein [Gudongella sp.]|nr:copper amine oxidase N-terminal domain-containing protein [Gudongella sp.]